MCDNIGNNYKDQGVEQIVRKLGDLNTKAKNENGEVQALSSQFHALETLKE